MFLFWSHFISFYFAFIFSFFPFHFIFPLFVPYPLSFFFHSNVLFPSLSIFLFPSILHFPFQIRMIIGWLKLLLYDCFLLLLTLVSPLRLHCFHPTALFISLSLSHILLFLISFGFFANAMPVVTDHVNGHCTSPTSQPCPTGKVKVPGGPEGPRIARRGPGRPPFRKAQSAACMEVSLPVSSLTEGVCLLSSLIPLIHLPLFPLSTHCPFSLMHV